MTVAKWSAVLSALAGISILAASFGQWWHINYDGGMVLKPWVKLMFGVLIAVQVGAVALALAA